ncbi:hypothetical protein D1871_20565 [Nakamurella silvestris]|nr:hypothetical protein D1871_20565 [Nakamurella silvestris]
MTARTLELLPVPTGRAVLSILPGLADALDGIGPARAPVPGGDDNSWATTGSAFAAGSPLLPGEDDPQDPTALVIATSGSTGTPKGSLLSARALAASAAATESRLGPGRWLLALPAHHIAGMQVLLRSVAAGTEPDVLDTGLPFTTERFVAAVEAMGQGPHHVSLVPTQLHRLLSGPTEGVAALSTFATVLVGGAATPAPLLAAARAAGVRVVTTYGMSETCGGCVYNGIPLSGVRVRIIENGSDNTVVGERGGVGEPEAGVIELSGPMVGRGYRGLPNHPAFPAPGTFRTNDLGRMSDLLTVVGRADDVIVTGGVKVSPGPVESVVSALDGVGEVVVTSIPSTEWGQEIVAVLIGPGPGPELPAIREAVTAALGSAAAPRHLLRLSSMATLPSGKPDRTQIRAWAAQQLSAG